ncbi:transglutaminase-like domain-containing protein [Gimesia aquarii]|uniref:Transglutaminase-like superfamily protein n=1 Tax=Gimesia aquarii TaxID=2527964 RepID=A0A517X2W2_9PLAN|nr:transglutaminase-like domain-containing protein [Gimesia aquarii]QDU11846.1 Transglutaminase-like superfamily protein [Gimesia aquarii]
MRHNENTALSSPVLHITTIVMVLIAALALSISDAEGRYSRIWIAVNFGIELSVVLLGMRYFVRLAKEMKNDAYISPLLLAVMLLSLLWEPVKRAVWGEGRPFELIMMFSVKNTLLVMAAAGCWKRYQKIAIWGSLFLIIFSATTNSSRDIIVLIGLELIVGFFWLFYSYWNSIRAYLIPTLEKHQWRKHGILSCLALVLLLILFMSGNNPIVHAFKGIMPSSGGEGYKDQYARDGLGDGDLLVAGKHDIRSFAPVENAPFLSSDEPSLYDIMFDTYNDDGEMAKNVDRAISLIMQDQKIEERELPESENINRHFSTARKQKPEETKSNEGLKSDALMYVSGRTPLHLRMETYDIFDGVKWHSEPLIRDRKGGFSLKERFEKPWIVVNTNVSSLFQECRNELHVITNNHLKSNQLPAPLHLKEIHIDYLDRTDMFGWHQESVVKLDRKELPRLVPIRLISHFPDPDLVEYRDVKHGTASHRKQHLALPEISVIKKVKKLAEEIVAGVENDWERIRKIEQYHRDQFQHDRTIAFNGETGLPLEKFLFEQKAGPDYLIATSTALMLRSLGYSTRVVSGFYASPDDYDLASDHTPIHSDDVHFWVEVRVGLGASSWFTVEPTQGYEVLGPPPTTFEKIYHAVVGGLLWFWKHLYLCLTLIASGSILYHFRFVFTDILLTRWFYVFEPRDIRKLVLRTLWLIELRMRWTGYRRPESTTINRWFQQTSEHITASSQSLNELSSYANWATYCPDASKNISEEKLNHIKHCCFQVIREARWKKT